MKNIPELLVVIRNLLESQKLGVLATQNHGQPYSNLIAFAATADLKFLLFATTRATRKFTNLMADPQVAMLVDNRKNDVADFAEAAAVTALGKAWEQHGLERQQLLEVYLKKHPNLKDFVAGPDCALIRVKVDRYIVVSRFQVVQEVQMTS